MCGGGGCPLTAPDAAAAAVVVAAAAPFPPAPPRFFEDEVGVGNSEAVAAVADCVVPIAIEGSLGALP